MSSTQASLCVQDPPEATISGESRPIVLVVDDDPCQLELLAYLLSEERYSVLKASSGWRALQVVAQAAQPPQLFLLDYHLGDMTGLDLYDLLHEREGCERTAAILLSCYLPPLDELQKRSIIGISKPYDVDAVLVQIASVISTAH